MHLPSGTEGYAKALLPWTLDPAVPTSCLVYLLLLSSLRAYEVLVPNVQTRFRALSSEMQTYVATCLLRITRQRSLQVQSTGFALLLESGFRLNPLEFGWSGEELLGMLFEGGIGLELFAAVLELTDSDALISALRQQQHGTEWTTPSKLFLLTNTLLLRLAVGFTPDHLVVLDGLAAICLEHGVELDALPTANLPSSVAGVQLRASVLKTAPNQQHQEEPLSFQLAVMERLSTGQFSQGDLSWLLVCFQQHRLPQATWRKVLIKLLCGGGDHLEARVLAAEILETLCWEGGAGSVDHQRCFDKALELFAIHHQPCGLRLMIRISLASISTDKDEGYIGQGVYSLVASTANPSTLLVLLLLMNGGQRPLDGFVKQRLAELLLPSGTGNDLCLVLVLVLVLRRLQPEIQLMELARARLRRITAHSVAEDNAILSGDLHRAAESGWGLTNPLAELVLGLSLSPTANATAAPALARMLLESCRI